MSRKLESRPDWQIALATTVALRVFFSAVAAVFSLFLHPDAALIRSNALTESLPAPHGLHYALLGIWERFDTLWYLRIAQHGYDLPMAVIFYPLYPLAIRATSWGWPAIAAALAGLDHCGILLFLGTAASGGIRVAGGGKGARAVAGCGLANQLRSFRRLRGIADSGLDCLGGRLCTRAAMGSSDGLRIARGIEPAFGSAGRDSAVGAGPAQPARSGAGGGSHPHGAAELLGLAAVVGTCVGGRSLPAAPGDGAGRALDGRGGSPAIDRRARGMRCLRSSSDSWSCLRPSVSAARCASKTSCSHSRSSCRC